MVADDASIAVRQGIVWLEGDGGIEIRKGAIEVADAMVGGGAVMICEREPGLESDRGIVVGDGTLKVITLIVGGGPIVVHEGPIWAEAKHPIVIFDRVLEVTAVWCASARA